MTAMELKCLKMELVEELLSIDDKDTLNRVKNYLKKLNNKIRTKSRRGRNGIYQQGRDLGRD